MPNQIDPTKPVDGVPAVKADLRANLQSAKDEIETLQSGKTDFGHQHVLADVTDSGALASKDIVQSADIATAAVTTAKLADAAVGGTKLADAVVTTVLLEAGSSSTGMRSSSSRPRHSRPTWPARSGARSGRLACTGSLPGYQAVRHDYPVSAAPSLSSANAWSAPKCPSAPSSSA